MTNHLTPTATIACRQSSGPYANPVPSPPTAFKLGGLLRSSGFQIRDAVPGRVRYSRHPRAGQWPQLPLASPEAFARVRALR